MISVIMPAYNASRFIRPAIESVLNQTYPHLELIVIDDGSTDNTRKIVREYAAKDARVRLIENEYGGVGNALNTGLNNAVYPWVAVLDADDVALPERFERQMQMAEADPEVVIWGTDGYHINSKGERISRFRVGPTSKEECRQMRAEGRVVQAIHPTVMYKRKVALKVGGYDARCWAGVDVELFDRMLVHGDLVTIPERLVLYRIHSGSLSMQKHPYQRKISHFVRERHKRRLAGEGDLDIEEFLEIYERRSLMQRLTHAYKVNVSLQYRRAGMAYGEGETGKAMFYLALATLLNPFYSLPRIWRQKLSPSARRNIQNGNDKAEAANGSSLFDGNGVAREDLNREER